MTQKHLPNFPYYICDYLCTNQVKVKMWHVIQLYSQSPKIYSNSSPFLIQVSQLGVFQAIDTTEGHLVDVKVEI